MAAPASPLRRKSSSAPTEPCTQSKAASQSPPQGVGAMPTCLATAGGKRSAEKSSEGASRAKVAHIEVTPSPFLDLSEKEKEVIKILIHDLATYNGRQLFWNQRKLREMGSSIEHIHPLKFITYIITNENLKKDLQTVHTKYNDTSILGSLWSRWGHFLEGFKSRMEGEMSRDNVEAHLPGFCEELKVKIEEIKPLIDARNWAGLLTAVLC